MKFDLTKYDTKKNKILNATFKCIYLQGITGITMRSIAKEAKVNQATVHYYFKTKDNLLFELLKVLFGRFIYDIERRYKPTDPPIKKITAILDAGQYFVQKQREMFVVFNDFWALSIRIPMMKKLFSELYKDIFRVIQAAIEEGIEKGDFRPIDKDRLGSLIISFVHGTGMHWQMLENPFDIGEHFNFLKDDLIWHLTKINEGQ